jgi:hypothetical protein
MYSGTTLRPLTGKLIGAHQKIDRLARGGLQKMLAEDNVFPASKLILHFEGVNGPDAIKRKSPAKDEPWHYFTPFDDNDTQLLDLIELHYEQLIAALKKNDEIRAAFEAAWLAHAIVDGLTPAHHYPYEEKLAELRGGKGLETRNTLKGKIIMPGETKREQLRNNWKMWGPKGLLNMHGTFEWGVAIIMAPLSDKHFSVTKKDLAEFRRHGLTGLFRRKAKEIDALGVYQQYERRGWTPSLARIVRKKVVPVIVQMVTLAWYAASKEAGLVETKK